MLLLVFTLVIRFFIGILWGFISPYVVRSFGLRRHSSLGALLAPFLFILVLTLLIRGFLPYSFSLLTSVEFVFALRFRFWFIAFLYLISSDRLALLFVKRGEGFFITLFMLAIEIMREFIKPVSLCVRLYANIMFGHYLIETVLTFLLYRVSPLFRWVVLPFIVFELIVFVIQSYIFTYLVVMYFGE